jgi:hypothetical protein
MEIAIQRASVVLGFLTLGTVLAIFGSCRTFVALLQRLGLKDPKSNTAYQAFYGLHARYWQAFVPLLLVHLGLALAHTGLLAPGNPDAQVHLRILLLGLGSALSGGILYSSCRITFGFFRNALKSPKGFLTFYALHSYYWLIVFGVIGAHFFFAHAHVGFWPMPAM